MAATVVRAIDPATPGYHISQPWGQLEGKPWGTKNFNGAYGHPGVDYAVGRGTPIRAIADYVCIYAGTASGFGDHAVALWHPALGIASTYGHAMANYVWYNQTGHAGDVIAEVDSEGQSTGDHLHLEIRPDDEPFSGNPPNIDPEQWLLLHLSGALTQLPTLTDHDRSKIKRLQYLLGLAPANQTGYWGKITDNAFQTLCWKLLTPPNKPYASSTVKAIQHDIFQFAAKDVDGIWGKQTMDAFNLARLCWLNK